MNSESWRPGQTFVVMSTPRSVRAWPAPSSRWRTSSSNGPCFTMNGFTFLEGLLTIELEDGTVETEAGRQPLATRWHLALLSRQRKNPCRGGGLSCQLAGSQGCRFVSRRAGTESCLASREALRIAYKKAPLRSGAFFYTMVFPVALASMSRPYTQNDQTETQAVPAYQALARTPQRSWFHLVR